MTENLIVPTGYKPQDAEPYMSPLMRSYFKQRLLKWRDEVSEQAKKETDAIHQDTEKSPDVLDEATSEMRFESEIIPMLAHDNDLLIAIDEALLRISRGTYGYCEQTGEPIGIARLEAWPIAALCIENEDEA